MASERTSRDGLRKTLAALAISATVLAACGSTTQALSGTAESEQRASVVRDPNNPHCDPDNPYWWMSNASENAYADPVRGPK